VKTLQKNGQSPVRFARPYLASLYIDDLPRVEAQEGVFTYQPDPMTAMSDQIAPESSLLKWTIPKDAKERIRNELRMLGITAAALFPDLDHLCRFVGELAGIEN
jgi:hypothetical protein